MWVLAIYEVRVLGKVSSTVDTKWGGLQQLFASEVGGCGRENQTEIIRKGINDEP